MAHVFRAKTFIADATALSSGDTDFRGNKSMSDLVQDYMAANDIGGTSSDIDEILAVSSCSLLGDRVFTIVVMEDETGGGGG